MAAAIDASSPAAPRAPRAARPWAWMAASAVAHATALVIGAVAMPAAVAVDDELLEDQQYIFQHRFIGSSDEREHSDPQASAPQLCGASDDPITGRSIAVRGPEDNPDPHIAASRGDPDAVSVWLLGVLRARSGGDDAAPTAPWGRDDSLGIHAFSESGFAPGDYNRVMAGCFGEPPPVWSCSGELPAPERLSRLGLPGIGDDVAPSPERAWKRRPAPLRLGPVLVSANVPAWLVRAGVRDATEGVRACYERALADEPTLTGAFEAVVRVRAEEVSVRLEASGDAADVPALACCVEAAQDAVRWELPLGTVATARFHVQLGARESREARRVSSR